MVWRLSWADIFLLLQGHFDTQGHVISMVFLGPFSPFLIS